MKTNDALQTNGHMMAAMAMLRVVLPFDLEMFSVVLSFLHVLDACLVMLKNDDHTKS